MLFRFFKQLFDNQPTRSSRPASCSYRPELESLEDRFVPSAATVDLSTAGAQGMVNGAIFQQGSVQPAGSGVIDAFVRIHGLGGAGAEQGFNTDARPLQFDENKSPTFTRSIHLSDIPEVNIGGVAYRVFLLDINQKSSQPLVSLDQLRIFEGDSGSLTGYDPTTGKLAGSMPLYDLNAGGGANWVELNARLSHGLGSSDMALCVPDADFLKAATASTISDPYVYVFSRFGDNYATNGGFEQWAVQEGTAPPPASLSGTVTKSGAPVVDTMVVLTGVDSHGNSVTLCVMTDANGFYSFDNLSAGTYTISLAPGVTDTATVGTLGGTGGADVSSIVIDAGQNGFDYNFAESGHVIFI